MRSGSAEACPQRLRAPARGAPARLRSRWPAPPTRRCTRLCWCAGAGVCTERPHARSQAVPVAALLTSTCGSLALPRLGRLAAWFLAWSALLAGSAASPRADEVSPDLGLWWYLFTLCTPSARAYVLPLFHAHGPLLLLPVAARLWRSPAALAVAAALCLALFKARLRCRVTFLGVG